AVSMLHQERKAVMNRCLDQTLQLRNLAKEMNQQEGILDELSERQQNEPEKVLDELLHKNAPLMQFWVLFSRGALIWTHTLLSPCFVPAVPHWKGRCSRYQVCVVFPLLDILREVWKEIGVDLIPS